MRIGDESVFVSGVKLLAFRGPPNVDILACCVGALKTDETLLLVCELAEPTPFKRSPCIDSLSSAGGGAESVMRMLLCDEG